MKKIILASDHAGYDLKMEMVKHAQSLGYQVEDLGADDSIKSVSYAIKGQQLSRAVQKAKGKALGVAICGTGLGMSFAVNRFKSIRGARLTSVEDARLAKEHNNANVLIFGGRQISPRKARKMFDTFVASSYKDGRHELRIKQLDK